jgi:single stranded DNA-binding protein
VNATEITVIGNVVNSPARNRTQNGSVTNFRVAATERRFDSAKQEWGDGSTFFVDVECWGELGGNVAHSISKGDPVVVVGAIRTHEWESDQGRRSRPQIRAEAVAPNLARGVADFRKTQRTAQAESQEESQEVEAPADTSATPPDELADLADASTSEDYGSGSRSLYEVDSENSSREPAHV